MYRKGCHQSLVKSHGFFARTPLKSGFRRLRPPTWATSSQALLFSHTLKIGFTGSKINGLRKRKGGFIHRNICAMVETSVGCAFEKTTALHSAKARAPLASQFSQHPLTQTVVLSSSDFMHFPSCAQSFLSCATAKFAL